MKPFAVFAAALGMVFVPAPAIAMPNAFWIFGFKFPASQKARTPVANGCLEEKAGAGVPDSLATSTTAAPANTHGCSDSPRSSAVVVTLAPIALAAS